MKILSSLAAIAIFLLTLMLAGCGSDSGSNGPTPPVPTVVGAIFTTDTVGTDTINIFAAKADVYLNGGPAYENATGIPAGSYYTQVTTPSGDVLGRSDGAVITASNGAFTQTYNIWSIVYKTDTSGAFTLDGNSEKIPGYESSSTNNYTIWVSKDPAFPESDSYTENFTVNEDTGGDPLPQGTITVNVFYDANANGIDDDGMPLTGWQIHTVDADNDYARYTPVTEVLTPNTYTVTAGTPLETNWVFTTPSSLSVTLHDGETQAVEFGCVCRSTGVGNAKGIGFWGNKNGQALIDSDDLAMLTGLNLCRADGSSFDPAAKTELRNWLQGAKSTNMANVLSTQLALMELNVFNGYISSASLVFAPGTNSADAQGFATVDAIMTEANTELGIHSTAVPDDSWYAYQEVLENTLAKAITNQTFIQSTPGTYTF